MSETEFAVVGWSIILIVVMSSAAYIWKFSSAANEFDVWFPTSYQVRIVKARNEARSGWLDLIRAVDEAKAKNMSPDLVARLEKAKDNAKYALDMEEMAIRGERAQIGDPTRYDRLLRRWGGE